MVKATKKELITTINLYYRRGRHEFLRLQMLQKIEEKHWFEYFPAQLSRAAVNNYVANLLKKQQIRKR